MIKTRRKKNVLPTVIYHFTICVRKKACFGATEGNLPLNLTELTAPPETRPPRSCEEAPPRST